MLRRYNLLVRATPAFAALQRQDPGRRKPDVACLGRNPLLALSDVGHWTLDLGLWTVNCGP